MAFRISGLRSRMSGEPKGQRELRDTPFSLSHETFATIGAGRTKKRRHLRLRAKHDIKRLKRQRHMRAAKLHLRRIKTRQAGEVY